MKIDLSFSKPSKTACDLAIFLVGEDGKYPAHAEFIGDEELVTKAADIAGFDPQEGGSFSLVAPNSSPFGKVIVIGVGKLGNNAENTWLNLGGKTLSKTDRLRKFTSLQMLKKMGKIRSICQNLPLD